jgi:radical SAM-linked protein
MRIRILFAKTEAMRFTGHLDLHKAWERTFRRAGLPLAYTQGFSPHPRLNLASALPLGFTGEAELLDAWLEIELPTEIVLNKLNHACPPGIQIRQITVADPLLPALQSQLTANDYEITLLEFLPGLPGRLAGLMGATEIPRQRRGKPYNLRPLILELQMIGPSGNPDGLQRIYTRLAALDSATGRPEEVLAALEYPAEAARFHRTRLVFGEASLISSDPPSQQEAIHQVPQQE